MAILLDSHAFFWWTIDDPKLSRTAHAAIGRDPEVYVSAVVAWEITGKVRIGKWPEAKVLADMFFETVAHYGMRPMPVGLEHAHLAGSLPGSHRDPFDRMLAAQAMLEDMSLVTGDPVFRVFEVKTLW